MSPIELLEDRLTPAVYVWDGEAADGKWSTLANWAVGGSDPGTLPTATDDVLFNSVALTAPQQLSTLDGADRSVQSVQVSATAAVPLTITAGNTLTIAALGVTINPGAEAVTISCALSLSGSQTWANNSSNLFTTTSISNGANTLTIEGSGNTAFTGTLGGGAGGLTKNGTGTLIISSTQTYTGATKIQNGTLNLQGAANLLPITAAVTLGDSVANTNGVLKLGAGATPADQTVLSLLTAGTGTGNAVVGGNSGTASELKIANTAANDYSGVFGGAGTDENNLALTKTGAGVLTLSGTTANTHTGLTKILAGAANLLRLNKTAGTNAIGGNLRIEPTATLVSVQLLAANQIPDTSLVTIIGLNGVGAGTLNMNNFDETIGGLDIQNGTSATTITLATGTKTLTVLGTMSFSGGSSGGTVVSGFLNLGGAVRTINSASTGTATPNISAVISNGGILKDDIGNIILSGANTYAGGTTVKGGALIAGVSNVTTVSGAFGPSTSGVTLGDSAGTNASVLANAFTVSNPITLGTSALGTLTIGSNGNSAAVFSGPISLNGGNVTIASGSTTGSFTVSGGITGTGNVTLNNNASTSTASSITTTAINNVGTITNSGTGGGTVTVSGGVGSNVTTISQSSTASALTISTTALNVNSGGTTLRNTAGTKLLTVSSGITGTGDLIVNNNSATAGGVTISGASVNNVGTITASGSGAGTVVISGGVGSNVTSINQNSTTSQLTVTTAPVTVNSGGTTLVNTLGGKVLSITGGITGTGNLILNNNSILPAGITIGTASVNNVGTITNSGTGTGDSTISGGVGANVTTITQNSTTSALNIITSAITVNSTGTTLVNEAGTKILTVSGGTTGTGNLILNNNSALAAGITVATTAVGHIGTTTNSGTGSGSTTISAVINPNSTGLVQNSATSSLLMTGASTFTSGTTIKAGTAIAGVSNATTVSGAFGTSASPITLGDSAGSSASLLANSFTVSNPITLGTNAVGPLTIGNNGGTSAAVFSGSINLNGNNVTIAATGTTGKFTISGGITGSGNVTANNNATTATTSSFTTASVNNTGTITNSGTGGGTTTITGGVGANVTTITQNSIFSALTISTTALTVNSTATTLVNVSGVKILTVSGGVTGTGDLILNNNSDLASGITISTTAVNNSGTITNSGTGIGLTTVSAAVGANVTTITESSTTSALTVSGAITVNATATTLVNALGTKLLTVSGGTTGTGNLIINNNSDLAAGITVQTAALGHVGTTTNSGTGTGSTTIAFAINANSLGLVQNSSTSSLLMTGASTFTTGTIIKAGTAIAGVSNATTVSGAFGTSASPITLGDSAGSSASLLANSFTVSNPITLGASAAGTLTVGNNGAATAAVFSGAINLNGNNLTIASLGTGSTTISGGVTGSGNVTISNGTTTATTTISTNSINNVGTITNAGTGTGNATISAVIGANVTGVTQNGTSQLILTGANLFEGLVKVIAGALWAQTDTNLTVLGTGAASIEMAGGELLLGVDGDPANYGRNVLVSGNAAIRPARTAASTTTGGGAHTLGTLTIGSQNLTIAPNSIITTGASTQNAIIFTGVTLTGSPTFTITKPTVGGTTTLTLGAIAGGVNNGIILNGNGALTQTGAWTATSGGTLSLPAAFSGIATLSQANTFDGGITVDGGIIAFNGSDTWNGNVQVNAGGAAWAQVNDATVAPTDTITLNGGILYVGIVSTAISFNRDVIVTANSTIRVTRNSTASTAAGSHTLGKLTIAGQTVNVDVNTATTATGLQPATTGTAGITFTSATVTGAPTFTVTNPATSGTNKITFTGLVTTGGDITVNGNGGGTFSGGFDLTGADRTLNYNAALTTTLAGPLSSTAAGNSLTLATTVAMTVGNVLAGANDPGIIVDSAATYTFSGTAGTFNGGVTINNNNAIVAIGASSVASAGAIVTGPLGTGLLTINGGNIRPSSAADRTLHNSILITNDFGIGNATLNNKLTLDPTQVTGGSITINGSVTMTTLGSGTGASHIFVGPITAGTGTVSLTKAGTTNVVFRNNTTIANTIPTINLDAGVYFVEGTTPAFMQNALGIASYNIGPTGGLGFNADVSITPTNTMVVANGGNISYRGTTATNALTLLAANLTLPTSGLVSFNRDTGGVGAIILTGGFAMTGDLTFKVGNEPADGTGGGGSVRVDGVISNAFNLFKIGNGNLILNNTNTYDGITTINRGTLTIDADDRLGVLPGVATPGSIVIDGGSLRGSGTFTLDSNRGIAIGPAAASGAGTIDVANSTVLNAVLPSIMTYNGIIADNGPEADNLTKTGAGTLNLGGANTYGGLTNVNGGALTVLNLDSLGTTAAGTIVNSGGTLQFAGGFNYTTAESIALYGTGQGGIGALNNLSGDNTISGPTITVASGAAIGSTADKLILPNSLNREGNGNLTFTGTGEVVVQAPLGNPVATPFDALQGRLFLATSLGIGVATGVNNINNLLPGGSLTPVATATLNGNLSFGSDAAFTAFFGGVDPGAANFTAVFYGQFTAPTTGDYYFAASNNDDQASFWIDSNSTNDGFFDPTDAFQSVALGNTATITTVTLTGGTTYNVAYAVQDTGGGSSLTGRAQFSGSLLPLPTSAANLTAAGTAGGVNNLIKTGTGTLRLEAHNTFSDAITIAAGTLQALFEDSLGVGSQGTSVIAGGTLELVGGITLNSETLSLSGPGAGGVGALNSTGGNSIVNTPITFVGSTTIGNGTASTLLTLGNSLTMSSVGNLTLTGAGNIDVTQPFGNGNPAPTTLANTLGVTWYPNQFTDTNLFNPNPISNPQSYLALTPTATTLANTDTFFDFDTAQLVAQSTISGAMALFGNRFGAVWQGTLNVGGINLPAGDISFGTNTDDGSVIYIDVNQNGVYEAAELIVSNGGNHGAQQRIGSVNLPAGAYNIYIGYYESSGGGSFEAAFGSGANLPYASQTFINPGNISQAGIWSYDSATINGLIKTGAGTATLLAANTYNSTTTVTEGTLVVGAVGAIPGTGNLVVNGGTFALGTFNASVAGVSLQSGSITGSTGILTSTLDFDLQSGSASAILDGAVNLVKSTAGTVLLTGANTYSGNTTVNAGTLAIVGSSSLPTTGVVTVNTGGNLDLANGVTATTVANAINFTNSSNLTFDWNGGVVDTLSTAAPATTTGTIGISINPTASPSGSGLILISAPAGGLVNPNSTQYMLSNNTNFTANLIVSDTAVTIGGYAPATALTSAYWLGGQVAGYPNVMAYSLNTASNWAVAAGDTTNTALGVVPGSAANVFFSTNTGATQQGNIVLGTNMSVNSVTFNDTTPVTIAADGSALTLNSAGTGSSSAISANENATINANLLLATSQTWTTAASKQLTVSGIVSGSAGLTIDGAGSTLLSGANTYTGITSVLAGSLLLGGNAPVSASGVLGNASSNVLLGGTSGAADASLLANTPIAIDRAITVQAGSSGLATLGGTHVNGTTTYNGIITLLKNVQLRSESSGSLTTDQVNFAGQIDDALNIFGVTKTGTGTVNLSRAVGNTYDGGTTVVAGTLLVNNVSGSATGTGTVLVQSSATLGGSGIIGGSVTVNGTLAPGNSIGTLAVSGANSLTLTGLNDFEIDVTTLTTDLATVGGALTYGGTLKITNLSGTFAPGNSWDLFNFGAQTGTFANNAVFNTSGDGVNLPSLPSSMYWQFDYATGVLSVAAVQAPTVTSITPVIGPTTGGTIVTILGANFISVIDVTFDGLAPATYSVISATEISATTLPHSAGAVEVVVTNTAGSGSLAGSNDFTFVAQPTVTSVVVNGGPNVTLSGTGSTVSVANQNSVVKQIVVTFSQAVTVASDAFTVTPVPVNPSGGAGFVKVNGGAAPSSAAVTASIAATLSPSTYLITFSGPGTHGGSVLNSGVYDLTTIASKITSAGGSMASNQTSTFFAMFGTIDANNSYTSPIPPKYIGDGLSNAFVDPGSLFQFSDAFGSNSLTPAGPPAYNVVFDSNLDGFVDPGDLFAFSDSFGIDWTF